MAGTIVKVCGITNLDDARVAVEAGADWLGFVLAGESPRRIEPERAAEISAAFPGIVTVAVIVGLEPEPARRLAERAGTRRVQLHRVNLELWLADFPLPVAFAVSVTREGRLATTLTPEQHLLLLDTAHATLEGGTGEPFPWEVAMRLAATRPVMIAGGLDGGNVADAIAQVRPFGVDASSRLERAPGFKDADKVRRFVRAVRECDERLARLA